MRYLDYLGGLGRMVRLRDRLQGGERWVIVWKLCGCSSVGMLGESRCSRRGGVLANALCFIFREIGCGLLVGFWWSVGVL